MKFVVDRAGVLNKPRCQILVIFNTLDPPHFCRKQVEMQEIVSLICTFPGWVTLEMPEDKA